MKFKHWIFIMDIETAIKQKKPFTTNRQKATVNLIYTYGWWMGVLRTFFKPFNLTTQQFNILRILKGAGKPLSTSEIRERMLDSNSDTTRIIDRMVRKDLVEKRVCPNDRRLVDVTLSISGEAVLEKVNSEMKSLDGRVSGLSETEAAALSNLLDKMRG